MHEIPEGEGQISGLPDTSAEPAPATSFTPELEAAGIRPRDENDPAEKMEMQQKTLRDLAGETGLSFAALRAGKRLLASADGIALFVALRQLYEQNPFTAPGCDAGYPHKRDGQADVVRLLRRIREADIIAIEN